MIYHYEAAVLKYIHGFIPQINLMTYAKQSEMFNAMSVVTRFPAFFYYRNSLEWSHIKEYYVTENGTAGNYAPFDQTYVGRILVEDQKIAMKVAHKLRFAWSENPYLYVAYPTPDYTLPVGMRLLYIKIDEERYADDKKGALRYVEFSWSSRLFMEQFYGDSFPFGLVEQVRIFLNQDGSVDVTSNEDLLAVIPQ